jgi:hypothetical protein
MLKTKSISALVLATAAAATQAQVPEAITFDGFCDGITGITTASKGLFTGTHAYQLCRDAGLVYTDTPMAGPSGRRMLGGTGNGIAGADSSYPQFAASFTYVVNDDGTWFLLAPEFGGLANLGTWSPGYGQGGVPAPAKASFSK